MTASLVCIATVVALAGSRPARAQCKPAVIAQGDPALVRGLTARLAASGIATSSSEGCPTLRVTIEQRGSQLHVRVADASQRTGERDVQDLATAAAVVESWTYQEIEVGILPDVPAEPPPALPGPPRTTRSGISASVLSMLGTDGGTTWVGASVSACMRIGSLCAGATVRTQLDTTATGDTSAVDQSLYMVGGLATLDLPRKLGGFIVSPGIGVGYTYLHVTTTHRDAMMNPFEILTSDHQLRGGVHAAVLASLTDHVGAFADVWVDAAAVRSNSQFGPAASVSVALGLRVEER